MIRAKIKRASQIKIDRIAFVISLTRRQVIHVEKEILRSENIMTLPDNNYSTKYLLKTLGLFISLGLRQKFTGGGGEGGLDGRVEFNPANCLEETLNLLDTILPNGAREDLLVSGRITRLDVNTDLYEVDLNDILVFVPRVQINRVYSRKLGLETIEYGSRKSLKSMSCYDKKLEMRKRGKILLEHDAMTRFEIRFNKKLPKFFDLASMENPFEKVEVYEIPNFKEQTEALMHFIDACRFRGPNNAITQLSISSRRKYNRKLRDFSEPYWWSKWHRAHIWKSWLIELQRFKIIAGKPD
tara:strand:+ start:284 stop:1177 length:894 start_codon:yes stop_codon:yes gene_type:complete